MRMNLAEGSRAGLTTALGGGDPSEFNIYHRVFDVCFVLAAGASFLLKRFGIATSDVDDDFDFDDAHKMV